MNWNKWFFILALSLSACADNGEKTPLELSDNYDGIVGGERVEEGQYKNVVALVQDGSIFCSGTLIHPRIVVTAAHCVDQRGGPEFLTPADLISVYIGEGQVEGKVGEGQYKAEKIAMHPDYNRSLTGNKDVAYILLSEDVKEVQPARVLSDVRDILNYLKVGEEVTLVGFGRREVAKAGEKFQVDVDLRSVGSSEVGVGRRGKTACNGDSGGPAFLKTSDGQELLFGVTSRGPRGCTIESETDRTLYGLVHDSICWIEKETGLKIDSNKIECGVTSQLDEAQVDQASYCQKSLSTQERRTLDAIEIKLQSDSCEATLTKLNHVESLDLKGLHLQDVRILSFANRLRTLDLSENVLQNASTLLDLSQLKDVDLSLNEIQDLDVLKNLEGRGVEVKGLYTQKTNLLDSPFSKMCKSTKLSPEVKKTMSVLHQALSSWNYSGDNSCDGLALTFLNGRRWDLFHKLAEKNITDLSPFAQNEQITVLKLNDNPIQDLSPLLSMTRLKRVELKGTSFTEEDKGVQKLKSRGVEVILTDLADGLIEETKIYKACEKGENASENDKRVIKVVRDGAIELNDDSSCKEVTREFISMDFFIAVQKQISDLSLLAEAKNINFLLIKGNQIEDLSPLSGLNALKTVDLSDNPISNLSVLLEVQNLEFLTLDNTLAEKYPEVIKVLEQRGVLISIK